MPTITGAAQVDAPPEAVWATLVDLDTYDKWSVTHVDFPDGKPALEQSASFKERVAILGMPSVVTWSVEEAHAPSRLALSGKGPMGTKLHYSYELSPAGDGTQLRVEADFAGAALRPMLDTLSKETSKALDESLSRLQGLLG